jgi:hypothetical protein
MFKILLSLSVLMFFTACEAQPKNETADYVTSYQAFKPKVRKALKIQVRGFKRKVLRVAGVTQGREYGIIFTHLSLSYSHGYGQGHGFGHVHGMRNTTRTKYEYVTSDADQKLIRTLIENLKIVDYVVLENDKEEADLIIEGDLINHGLTGTTQFTSCLQMVTFLPLFGFPLYESGTGTAQLRVYDPDGKFIKSYQAEGEADRWQSWAWTNNKQSVGETGDAACMFAGLRVVELLARDLEAGIIK